MGLRASDLRFWVCGLGFRVSGYVPPASVVVVPVYGSGGGLGVGSRDFGGGILWGQVGRGVNISSGRVFV